MLSYTLYLLIDIKDFTILALYLHGSKTLRRFTLSDLGITPQQFKINRNENI